MGVEVAGCSREEVVTEVFQCCLEEYGLRSNDIQGDVQESKSK